jgi:hypothetical protein
MGRKGSRIGDAKLQKDVAVAGTGVGRNGLAGSSGSDEATVLREFSTIQGIQY